MGSKESNQGSHKCFENLSGCFSKTETDASVYFVPKALIQGLIQNSKFWPESVEVKN